jgi:putative nucleotidyltransferase with HDIG domain
MDPELKRAIALVGELPSIPTIASQIMAAAAKATTSADDLRKIIEKDPSLSARVLKVANSSLYGFRREIETLRHAVTLLGFKTVECLVMAASLRDVFRHFGLSEKLLWEHATVAGVAASKLATYGPVDVDREQAFTAGLLHDLGKIALANVFRERYHKVMARTYNEQIACIDAERAEFGFDHAVLGAHVAEKWQLPKPLVAAIRYHHHEPDAYRTMPVEHFRLVALTSLTTRVCTRLGLGRRGPIDAIDVTALPAWGALGLGEEDVEPVTKLVAEEAKAVEGLFR